MFDIKKEFDSLTQWSRKRLEFSIKHEVSGIEAWYLESYIFDQAVQKKNATAWFITKDKIIKTTITLDEIEVEQTFRTKIESIVRKYKLLDEEFDGINDVKSESVIIKLSSGQELVLDTPSITRCNALENYRNFISTL